MFHELLGAFHAAHQLILQEGGLLTTLCVAVVCPLAAAATAASVDWTVCACNVGDSLCFVYSQTTGVREVTLGSHDIRQMRDMRDAGGALGPVDGVNPELQVAATPTAPHCSESKRLPLPELAANPEPFRI